MPEGDPVTQQLASVEQNWTTNVMVIYVESDELNVTTVEILEEIDALEKELNHVRNDRGGQDNIIYLLSEKQYDQAKRSEDRVLYTQGLYLFREF